MKKTIALSTFIVLAMALAGCQAPQTPTATVPEKEAAGETSTAQQEATLEVTEEGQTAVQEASLTITEGEEGSDTMEQEASLTITEGEDAEPAVAEQEASLTITE